MNNGNSHSQILVGADVGGTKVSVLVATEDGEVLGQATLPTVLDGPEGTLEGISAAIESAVSGAGCSMREVACVGVGVPGRVNPATGVVRQAVNLGWQEMPVARMLSERLGVLCVLENDVRVAALGVHRFLGAHPPDNMAYISVGTGIAAGLILNGALYRGTHSLAGEIGHMVIEPDGPPCRCGAHGCLEALASGPAIARMGEVAAHMNEQSALAACRPVTAEGVYRAAREGDDAALEITGRAGSYLALAVQQLIVAYDVECLVFGGGVSRDGDTFLRPVLESLAKLREGSVLTGEMLQPEAIRLLPPGYEAGAWGAVILAGTALRDPTSEKEVRTEF